MYSPIPQGSIVEIEGLKCHVPPVGYVVDRSTGELRYVGVYKRSDIPEEQYWERPALPIWYHSIVKAEDEYEKKKKDGDPAFYDERYEKFKSQEWDRRLNGFWFMNNGNPIYLVGVHYMFLTWIQIDIGFPKFRITDLERFYFWSYCAEDPICMGDCECCKRRDGKTIRAGTIILDIISRTKMANGGIQSKTGSDGKKFFSKAIIWPFRKLPRFFRPVYDTAGGVHPKTELRFQRPNVKGKKAEEIGEDELGSLIDYGTSGVMDYDGQKLIIYVGDEVGKTSECNVYDRHEVIRYCLLDDEANIIGKAHYTTTVEKLETDDMAIVDAFKLLWIESDQNNRGEDGKTGSGLYRIFIPADRSRYFDKYGFPDVERARKEILAGRKAVEHNPRAFIARIRKEPLTIEEAFMDSEEECHFNLPNILYREKQLKEKPVFKRKMRYERDELGNVKLRDARKDESYYWEFTQFPPDGEENKFEYVNGIRSPGRTRDGVISVDGYSNSQGGRKYGSKACAWMGRYYNISDPKGTGKAIGRLFGRPNDKNELHEQVMLACIYNGYKAWYEHNADDYYSFFRDRGCINYLGRYPWGVIEYTKRENAERYYGFPTTPFSLTKQMDAGVAHFNIHIDKIDWETLLQVAKKFNPYERTKYDEMVSYLMLLVLLNEPLPVQDTNEMEFQYFENDRPDLIYDPWSDRAYQ